MHALADAVVYAVTYIDLWHHEHEDFLAHDVGALESIGAYLEQASDEERTALAAAAERALAEELASPQPRKRFVESYRSFMEDMFGEPWSGNARVG